MYAYLFEIGRWACSLHDSFMNENIHHMNEMGSLTRSLVDACANSHVRSLALSHTHVNAHARARAHMSAHACTNTQARAQKHTHTHTNTHPTPCTHTNPQT